MFVNCISTLVAGFLCGGYNSLLVEDQFCWAVVLLSKRYNPARTLLILIVTPKQPKDRVEAGAQKEPL